jgi:hypothetical protein
MLFHIQKLYLPTLNQSTLTQASEANQRTSGTQISLQ